jgi:Foie gras liver health family 1
MFDSTALLPPRTKRWAEAKVLADCINFKVISCASKHLPFFSDEGEAFEAEQGISPTHQICKIYLYVNESPRVLASFNRHLARFRELSNGWGIGEETFEFWAWFTKQSVSPPIFLPFVPPPSPNRTLSLLARIIPTLAYLLWGFPKVPSLRRFDGHRRSRRLSTALPSSPEQ